MERRRAVFRIQGMQGAACVRRIEEAMRRHEGVLWATVNFASGEGVIWYDPSTFRWADLVRSIQALGYEIAPEAEPPTAPSPRLRSLGIPAAVGLGGMGFLLGLYLGLVTLAQGWEHALALLWGDRWLVGLIAAGFGTQVGLYTYLRRLRRNPPALGPSTAMAAAGTGTSSAAMIACCAHHVTDALPILGLSAAATLLNQYRVPFMLVGIGMNILGIAWISVGILQAHGHWKGLGRIRGLGRTAGRRC